MRGVTIAIFLLCVSVFGTFMAVSLNGALGLGMQSGLQEPADKTQEELSGQQNVSERGGSTGLLGFAVYAARTLSSFFSLYTSIGAVLKSWAGGYGSALWNGAQMIVVVVGTLMIVWVARGLIGE